MLCHNHFYRNTKITYHSSATAICLQKTSVVGLPTIVTKVAHRWCTYKPLPSTFWDLCSTSWRCQKFGHWRASDTPTFPCNVYWRRPERPRNIPGNADLPALTRIQVQRPRIVRLSSDRNGRSASRWRHFRYSAAGNLHRCNTQQHTSLFTTKMPLHSQYGSHSYIRTHIRSLGLRYNAQI